MDNEKARVNVKQVLLFHIHRLSYFEKLIGTNIMCLIYFKGGK